MQPSEPYLSSGASQTLVQTPLDPEERRSRAGALPAAMVPVPLPQKASWSMSWFCLHENQILSGVWKSKDMKPRWYNSLCLGHGCGTHLAFSGGALMKE